jgi:hypothetical protein
MRPTVTILSAGRIRFRIPLLGWNYREEPRDLTVGVSEVVEANGHM